MSDPPQFSMTSLASALPHGVGIPSSSASSGISSGVGGAASNPTAAAAQTLTAAEALLNSQLASALSTMGDAQYFEDSISPAEIRTSLAGADPSNPTSTPALLRGMKWLLASMSKGRDVSDFFPHVVKLVGSHSLEVRKMVYIYLGRYADFDPTCRELALLAINSFQRGLADGEPLIRALALRTMTSIRVRDVLQIQIMAVQRCAADTSPYVRKCAANALTKLHPRCPSGDGASGRDSLLEIMAKLLDEDSSTMVLTSAFMAFTELCPERLDLLHKPYRKVCHLLTDMDEWGQVVILDTLARYCRKYFKEPRARSRGSAELIDRERRVRRTVKGIAAASALGEGDAAADDAAADDAAADAAVASGGGEDVGEALDELFRAAGSGNGDKKNKKKKNGKSSTAEPALPPHPGSGGQQKIKRRVVKKAFYSDEEDESTEEEVYIGGSVAATMKQSTLIGQPRSEAGGRNGRFGPGIGSGAPSGGGMMGSADDDEYEDSELDEDHRLLLRSSLPLLKSRNSGVVLAVCSLHYYCGVASIRVRAAVGKSLVRIYRDKREIQYVVLTSIRTLVQECPSAFTPFLSDFFVKAMDPQFTRMIKLEILSSLCLDPGSIEAVLKEIRMYIRHNDKGFVRASIQTVGKVAEMTRIVYDRRGAKTESVVSARADADLIALNCLYGLITLSQASDDASVVGECVIVMENVLRQLLSESSKFSVADPNKVHSQASKRLIQLLIRALDAPRSPHGGYDVEETMDREGDDSQTNLKANTVLIPPDAVASALSMIGDWFCASSSSPLATSLHQVTAKEKSRMRSELLRMISGKMASMEPCEKLQCIHFASKALLTTVENGRTSSRSDDDKALCEFILAMGRVDVIPDVRDRARFESNLLNLCVGLSIDIDALLPCPPDVKGVLTTEDARAILLGMKHAPSHLPVEEDDGVSFRFGSLSSLLSHKAGKAYIPLPEWAEENSSGALRAPPEPSSPENKDCWKVRAGENNETTAGSFYKDDSESSSSDESSSGPSSDSDTDTYSDSSGSSYEDSSSDDGSGGSSDESSSDESDVGDTTAMNQIKANGTAIVNGFAGASRPPTAIPSPRNEMALGAGESSSSSEGDSSSGSEESSSEDDNTGKATVANDLLDMSSFSISKSPAPAPAPASAPVPAPIPRQTKPKQASSKEGTNKGASGLATGLEGLVMAPIVVDKDEDMNGGKAEVDSSQWKVLVRPELSGGLQAKARFLRGRTKDRETQTMGFDTANSTVICVQIKFENLRTDSGVLRRVRLIQRSAGGSGTFSPRRLSLPLEIGILKKGQSSTVLLGLEFTQKSDKDKVFLSKLEVKSDRGTNAFEIRPPLAEMTFPYLMKRAEFDAAVSRLQGITQRTVSSFALKATSSKSIQQLHTDLPQAVVKNANLYPVDKKLGWKADNSCDFAGRLPASETPIFVTTKADPDTGVGSVVVHCDDLMAANTFADFLKRAVGGMMAGMT